MTLRGCLVCTFVLLLACVASTTQSALGGIAEDGSNFQTISSALEEIDATTSLEMEDDHSESPTQVSQHGETLAFQDAKHPQPKASPGLARLVAVEFNDTDGDFNIFKLEDGHLAWYVNDKLVLPKVRQVFPLATTLHLGGRYNTTVYNEDKFKLNLIMQLFERTMQEYLDVKGPGSQSCEGLFLVDGYDSMEKKYRKARGHCSIIYDSGFWTIRQHYLDSDVVDLLYNASSLSHEPPSTGWFIVQGAEPAPTLASVILPGTSAADIAQADTTHRIDDLLEHMAETLNVGIGC